MLKRLLFAPIEADIKGTGGCVNSVASIGLFNGLFTNYP